MDRSGAGGGGEGGREGGGRGGEEERRRRTRRRRTRQEEATDIKSNNPHLAGGEKQQIEQCAKTLELHGESTF